MNKIALSALVVALPLLGACAGTDKSLSNSEAQTDPHFGEALKRDMAAQIVNPMAPEGKTGPAPMDGQRAGLAQDRYAKDKVKQPDDISIGVQIGTGGSGGGSGGGSSQ